MTSVVCVGQNVTTTGGETRGPPCLAATVSEKHRRNPFNQQGLRRNDTLSGQRKPRRNFSRQIASEYILRGGRLWSVRSTFAGINHSMQELIAEQPKDWLQLYVDAVTEKDPYKRLALVRQLREVPRHDESDESNNRSTPRQTPNSVPAPSKRPQVRLTGSRNERTRKPRPHLVRSRKTKAAPKTARRSARLRSA